MGDDIKQKEVEKKVDGHMMAFMSIVDEVQDVNKQNLMLRQRVRDLWIRCVKSETVKTIPELKECMCYSFDFVNDSEEVKSICVFDPTEARIICNKGVTYQQFLNNLQHQSFQCRYVQIDCTEHDIESTVLFVNPPIKVADKLKYKRRGGFYFKKTNYKITAKTRMYVTLNPKTRITIKFIPEYDWSEIH